MEEEALGYLDSLVNSGDMDQRVLRNFWVQFQQVGLNAARTLELESPGLLAAIEQGDSASSLPEIQAALKDLTACFPRKETFAGNEKKLVEQVRKYVEDNLDQTLNVNDVATALYMNADYLSRVFKTEMGIP